MANGKHLKTLGMGVDYWNSWRDDNPDIRPDLSGSDLREKTSGIRIDSLLIPI